jgi:threonine/homoserine/homoserine lactone efflux protein
MGPHLMDSKKDYTKDAVMDYLYAVVLFAISSSITPGPNNIMVMTSGLNFGVRRSCHCWPGSASVSPSCCCWLAWALA